MPDLALIKRNVTKMASMQAPEADIDGYISQSGVTVDDVRNFKLQPQAQDTTLNRFPQKLRSSLGEFFTKSIPQDIGEVATSIPQAFTPTGIKNLAHTVAGTVEKTSPVVQLLKMTRGVPKELASEKYADAAMQHFKDSYGSLDAAKKYAYHHPIQFSMDLSMALGAGGGALSKVGEASKIADLETIGKLASKTGEIVDPMRVPGRVLKIGDMGKKIGASLKESSGKSYTKALGPTVKGEKQIAGRVVPELVERKPFFLSRKGYLNKAEEMAQKTGENVDIGYQKLNPRLKFKIDPVLKAIDQKLESLKVNGVVPEANAAEHARLKMSRSDFINTVLNENAKVSPQTARQFRQVLDKSIEETKQGFKMAGRGGAKLRAQRFLANTIRREMAKQFPSIAKLNKEFHFWNDMTDLLETTAPKEKTAMSHVRAFTGLFNGKEFEGVTLNLGRLMNDNAAWNSFMGAQKSRFADLLTKGNFKGANNLINAARIAGNISKSEEDLNG